MRVQVGDAVTTVKVSRQGVTIVHGQIAAAFGVTNDLLRIEAADAHRFFRRLDLEGITWIRGTHAPGSEQADALLGAYALVQPEVGRRRP